MLFRYDKKRLMFCNISTFKLISFFALIFFINTAISISIGYNKAKSGFIREYTEAETSIFIKDGDSFSEDKLVKMIKDLNIKFPEIVMAQSIIETGRWKSNIFHENNNLFGMKEARRRITTAAGTQNNHAYYNHWRESVYDYAFFQCRYLYKIKTSEEYFKYLSANYAEDSLYVSKIKNIIKNNNLESYFN